MPKIRIPKIERELRLADYQPQYEEATIHVWVNPPRKKMDELQEIRAELYVAMEKIQKISEKQKELPEKEYLEKLREAGEENQVANQHLYQWHSEIWSQAEDPETHWTPEEVKALADMAMENDPQLWSWALRRTWEMITEYRSGHQKK